MSVLGLSGLHPEVRARVNELFQAARAERLSVTLTSAFRSPQKQRQLYQAWLARGRTGLPAAPPGMSTHEYGYAVDLFASDQARLVYLAGCAGLHWAGPRDRVHFDVFGPPSWRALLAGRTPTVPPYPC